MNKNVGIAGYASLKNYGDTFIVKCNEYLVESLGDYEITTIDFEAKMNMIQKWIYYAVLLISKILKNNSIGSRLELLAVNINCRRYYKRQIQKVDAIIFANGSFKYGTQKQWAYEALIVDLADKYNVPVMFNACNIQKFNSKDWKCCYLTKRLNKKCVKMITSRDGQYGVERLQQEYHLRKDIVCQGVGDVAYWIPETYEIHKKVSAKAGINLIYGNIFQRYGKTLCEDQLLEAYNELLHLLDQNQIEWELFTNGLENDLKFGRKLLEKYGNKDIKIRVPKSDVELITIISNYKGILGARLHACISAYALDIPFAGMIWDEKLFYFSRIAEVEKYLLNEDEINGLSLYNALNTVLTKQDLDYDSARRKYKNLNRKYVQTFLENYLC